MNSATIDKCAETESHADSIDTWLAVLTRFLDVSAAQRDAIRDEIESHLRERVRDLMITGHDEPAAIHTALNELGEVADLARRFSHASRSRTRRTLMNAAVIAFGAIGVATAAVFINSPQNPSPVAVFENQSPASVANEAAILDGHKVQVHFDETELQEVLQYLAAAAGTDLVIDRNELEFHGVSIDKLVTLNLSSARPVAEILELIARQTEPNLAWRVHNGILEVATTETFDRREVVLASFDVQDVLDLIWQETNDTDESIARLEQLMIEYVEPDAWYVNGGDLATLQVIGGKMFVKAPRRFHQPIQWILGQLEENAARQVAAPGAPSAVGGTFGAPVRDVYRALPPGTTGGGAGGSTRSTFDPLRPTPGGAVGGGRAGIGQAAPSTGNRAGAPGSGWGVLGPRSTPEAETPAEPVEPVVDPAESPSEPEAERRDR